MVAEGELPPEYYSEGFAAFILLRERIGAADDDAVLELVSERLEQLRLKAEVEASVEEKRSRLDALQAHSPAAHEPIEKELRRRGGGRRGGGGGGTQRGGAAGGSKLRAARGGAL